MEKIVELLGIALSIMGMLTIMPRVAFAQGFLPIIISEVQIAGEKAGYDFIELYNDSDSAIDLTGYRLRKRTASGNESSIISIGATPENSPAVIIPVKGYFLWSSSKDGYHIQVGAHVFTTQTIAADNSIALVSPSPDNTIIDAVAWGEGLTNPFVRGNPYPQNPEANKSLSRWSENGQYRNTHDNSVDFTVVSSTPRQENISVVQPSTTPPPTTPPLPPPPSVSAPVPVPAYVAPEPPPSPPLSPVPASEPSSPPSELQDTTSPIGDTPTGNQGAMSQEELPKQIGGNVPTKSLTPPTSAPVSLLGPIITEFLPYPEENDAENEWIELYNPHNEEIYISGWKVKDISGKTHVFSIPSGTRIAAKDFTVFRRPQTSIVLNNDGDGVALKSANGTEIDKVEYEGKAKRGYSYARKEDDTWSWTSKVTEGTENMFLGHRASAQESTKDESQEAIGDSSRLSTSLASVNQSVNGQNQKFAAILLIAGLTALFSAAGILFLKIRLLKW